MGTEHCRRPCIRLPTYVRSDFAHECKAKISNPPDGGVSPKDHQTLRTRDAVNLRGITRIHMIDGQFLEFLAFATLFYLLVIVIR